MSAVISVGKASARSDYPACRVPQNLWMPIAPLFAANRPRTNPKQLAANERPKAPSGGSAKCIFESSEFKQLDDRTKRVRRNIIDVLCREHGNKPVRLMEVRHVRYIRDARADHFEAANAILKALRQIFVYGVAVGLVDRNPAKEVPYLKSGSPGFHSWTSDEVRQFEATHPIGSKARLAFALLFYTAQRRSDIV